MHPLNKAAFGSNTGTIQVQFNNNSVVEAGYIVKQTGSQRFVISNALANTVNYTCTLYASATPGVGQATILANTIVGGAVSATQLYVGRIDAHHVVCSDGNQYMWTLATTNLPSANGTVKLATN